MEITGAVALVTGGASGLGLATARRLAGAGARVVLVDLPSSDGEKVAAELGDGAVFAPADVTDEAAVTAALDAADGLGTLRVVVNCAGIATPGKVLGRGGVLALDAFERVVRVNLVGTFNVLRLAAARIAAADPVGEERGVIVYTASVAAFEGQIGQAAYSASKAGIAGMTLPVARELASSLIRVVSIAPGIFATPMLAGLPQEAQDSLGKQVPHPSRLGRPEEFAALVEHIVEQPDAQRRDDPPRRRHPDGAALTPYHAEGGPAWTATPRASRFRTADSGRPQSTIAARVSAPAGRGGGPALAGVRENLGAGPGSGDPAMPGTIDRVTVPRPPSCGCWSVSARVSTGATQASSGANSSAQSFRGRVANVAASRARSSGQVAGSSRGPSPERSRSRTRTSSAQNRSSRAATATWPPSEQR